MRTWIWIEGFEAFDDFCERRFGEVAHMIENTGTVGTARVRKVYKWREDWGQYVAMFLLHMEAPGERCPNLAEDYQMSEIEKMTYDQIRLDRTALLRR